MWGSFLVNMWEKTCTVSGRVYVKVYASVLVYIQCFFVCAGTHSGILQV